MIFTLGVLSAGLLTLLFLPVHWKRAVRLSKRRLENQAPLSMTEIVAERDHLRAEFAIDRRRLEQDGERMNARHAEAMAQIGRAALAARAAEERLSAFGRANSLAQEELKAAAARIVDLETQFGALHADHHDLGALLKRRTEELSDLHRRHRELADLADERRTVIAGLETRVSGLEMRAADLVRDLRAAQAARSESAEEARSVGEQNKAAQKRAAALERRMGEIESESTTQARRGTQAEEALGRSRQALAQAKSEIADLTHELALAEERAKALRGSLERQTETRRGQERDHAARVEELQGQLASLKGALAEAREEGADLRRASASPGQRPRAQGKNAGTRQDRPPRKELESVLGEPSQEKARAGETGGRLPS